MNHHQNRMMPGDGCTGESRGRGWPHAGSSCFQPGEAARKTVALHCVRSNRKRASVVLLRTTRPADVGVFRADALRQRLLVMFETCLHLHHWLELETHGRGQIPADCLRLPPHVGPRVVKRVGLTFGRFLMPSLLLICFFLSRVFVIS